MKGWNEWGNTGIVIVSFFLKFVFTKVNFVWDAANAASFFFLILTEFLT